MFKTNSKFWFFVILLFKLYVCAITSFTITSTISISLLFSSFVVTEHKQERKILVTRKMCKGKSNYIRNQLQVSNSPPIIFIQSNRSLLLGNKYFLWILFSQKYYLCKITKKEWGGSDLISIQESFYWEVKRAFSSN